ncbi:MAG TPA: cadmium resistance transporter [Trebonia sp.]|nr:cadmium resistance transporter [Trebonia sp.]
MSSLPAQVAEAVGLFAGTNIDDVVVLTLLNAASRAGGRPRRWEIWGGQYVGFGVLVGVSLGAGRSLALVPAHWLWLLALIPLGLGIANLVAAIRSLRRGEEPAAPSAGGLPGVAMLTIVNGADALAAYAPFFATAGKPQTLVTLVVFAVCVALWCLTGALLTRHKRVTETVSRYGHWILPAAFILIGLYILHETGAPFGF